VIKINSKNLLLKELNVSDVSKKYLNWLNDKSVNQFLEVRHLKQNINTCKSYIEEIKKSKNDYLFGIFLKKELTHIGNIKLTISHPREKIADIGIFIGDKNFHGKGYATESIKMIINFAFKDLKIKRIQAGFYDLNYSGIKSFLNSGFKIDGYLKSFWVYKKKRVGRILASIINDK
jgi:[ribosomal protein S5]-alanine N-acetyltransferase